MASFADPREGATVGRNQPVGTGRNRYPHSIRIMLLPPRLETVFMAKSKTRRKRIPKHAQKLPDF